MPEVSRFFGIVIRFYHNDHEPAHFHAVYGDHEALIEVETLAVLRGELPRRALALVLEWAAMRREELRSNWARGRSGQSPIAIAPLDQGGEVIVGLIRIAAVVPLKGFEVELMLTTGETIRRDLGPLLNGPIFDRIRSDEEVFRAIRVENGTVVWPNGADLCPDVLIWGGLPPEDVRSSAA